MNKKRTIFYFDGFNLHHGMLKNTPQRWLDLEKFANALLPRPDEHEIIRRPPEWCRSPIPNMATMTDNEIDAEIQRGLDSAKAGNYRPVAEARTDFPKKHIMPK